MTRDELEALIPAHPWPPSEGKRQRHLDRLEDYLFIGGPRLHPLHAAARLGVTRRTVERWRRLLREAP